MGKGKSAEIEGLTLVGESKEDKKVKETSILDEILENQENARLAFLLEQELSNEAIKIAQGEFDESLLYNMPRWSALDKGGQVDWGHACDRMLGGCSMKRQGTPHVHIIGVGINGAKVLGNAYMGLTITPQEPRIVDYPIMDGNGLVSTVSYWIVQITGFNEKTKTKLTQFYAHPVFRKKTEKNSTYSYTYDEFGFQISLSKAHRNLVLSLLPTDIQKKWVQDYRDGKKISTEVKEGKKTETRIPAPDSEDNSTDENKHEPKDGGVTCIELTDQIARAESEKELDEWFKSTMAMINELSKADKLKVMGEYRKKLTEFTGKLV